MGGGTGTYAVIQGIKREPVSLTAIIAVSDSGGSTGRLRDEFGFQPVGDLRQSLAAIADAEGEEWIRKILLYRFSKGEGLKGHNLGNLLLTALQDMTGDTTQALEIASRVFRLHGRVVPATSENVQLKIQYQNGQTKIGEHILDEDTTKPDPIESITLEPQASIHPQADHAIRKADLIVIGPGDYYASLLATLAPLGVPAAFKETNAKVVYIINLMTRKTQTDGMSAAEHVAGIERAIGRPIDAVIVNNAPIPEEILHLYAKESEFPVVDDLPQTSQIIRAPLISELKVEKSAYDTAHRSVLRHDGERLREVVWSLLQPMPDQAVSAPVAI
jgi:uncharacterized cofD-like protein